MTNIATFAVYRLRVAYQLGAVSRADWLHRAGRISRRFGVAL